jgi:hypothetical protein
VTYVWASIDFGRRLRGRAPSLLNEEVEFKVCSVWKKITQCVLGIFR